MCENTNKGHKMQGTYFIGDLFRIFQFGSSYDYVFRGSFNLGVPVLVLCFMLAVWLVFRLCDWPKWLDKVLILLTLLTMVMIWCLPIPL